MKDQRQTQLVFEPGEKGRLLRAARQNFGLTPERCKRVFDLVNALDQLGFRDGCRPGVKRIADQMARSERTVQNAIRDAVAIGVVAVEERTDDNGSRLSNLYVIVWDAIRRYARMPAPVEERETASGEDGPGSHGASDESASMVDAAAVSPVTPPAGHEGDRPSPAPTMVDRTPRGPGESVAPGGATRSPGGASVAGGRCNTFTPYSSPLSSKNKKTSSPNPSSESGWTEVGEVLVSCGVAKARTAIATAKGAGVAPAEVLALAEYWREQEAWGAGALYSRIIEALPGQAVETGWPAPSPAAVARNRKRAAEAAARDRAAELRRLESLAGEALDRMATPDRDALARQVLDCEAAQTPGPESALLYCYMRHHQREPPSAWPAEIRLAVLKGLVSSQSEVV